MDSISVLFLIISVICFVLVAGCLFGDSIDAAEARERNRRR